MQRAVQLNKKQKTSKQNRAIIKSAFFMGSVSRENSPCGQSQAIYIFKDYGYMIFKIKKTHPAAKIPTYALSGDAGMDLYSIENITIDPMAVVQVKTGVEIELPKGTVGLVWDKSGLATNYGISVMGGVFDENYRGELIVSLINLSKDLFAINQGEKVAQLLIQKIEHPEVIEVRELSPSERGRGRLGSTGKK